MISSLGGRWPKKLRSLEGRLAVALSGTGLKRPAVLALVDVGEEGGSSARSGSRTPKELRMLIELARLGLLEGLRRGLSVWRGTLVRRRKSPCSRVGWFGGAWHIDRSSASVRGSPAF